ncbi:MAG TPA: phosphate ABC transporter ATP-binding protein [Candidatus Pseudogracilibacillus intestinigallinarum]|uniref:Phosphate ABC transporter ATP-binding protein n=1 Tax=Candidatus Pseudogracilibacillus intestinigallinarum TaxID=2838742 RepID=A0A9D1PNB0_9BACI|nr:phosphate ABC transporter ATP-binding protein [Candidatus Pseudogracilibacillus intestinigallinarum]
MTYAISFENIYFTVKDRHILNNITGNIEKGKITALVGPSGAGKSTLLKMCNGLLSPTSGHIFIDGDPITSYEPTLLRRKVGFALQNAPMIRETVYDNINLPYALNDKTISEQEAIDFLELVGLHESFLHTSIDDLSGGERQRVSLARTLVPQSDILLLDEITSALDEQSMLDIEQLIIHLKNEKNLTIIWITHQMEQAKRCADNIWVLMDGKLEEIGSSAILSHSANERVEQFLHGGVK